ncbi:MAG: hypothetical protein WC340_11550 [Kiritimatiellia bacterium]|jgi:hypothetical protein
MKHKNMMKERSLFVAWLILGTLLVQTAAASDWYVALDGTGQGAGGWANNTKQEFYFCERFILLNQI